MTTFLHSRGFSILELDKDRLRLVLDYLVSERKLNEKTLNNYYCAISSFFDYLTYENIVKSNPVQGFRKRYLKNYKKNAVSPQRKLITVEQASQLINSALSICDKAVMTVLAKTGVRRGELISMDVDDIDWPDQRIKLKPKNKRSNLYVYFDEETAMLLQRWLTVSAREYTYEEYLCKKGARKVNPAGLVCVVICIAIIARNLRKNSR